MAHKGKMKMKWIYKIKRLIGFSCGHDYRQIGLRADRFYACYSVYKCSKCDDLMYRIDND